MTAVHEAPHPKARQAVTVDTEINSQHYSGEAILEDWWDRVSGGSWMHADGNPAAMIYGLRAAMSSLPLDDEVVYVKINSMGHLLHVSELMD